MSLTDDLGRSPEAALLRRARAGDGAAFGALYERHLGVARRLARSLVADRSDADDVVAEVFAATFVAMRRGSGPAEDFRSYLLRSIRRECQKTWRRSARQRPGGEVVVDLAAARATGRDDFDWSDEGDVVHQAFAALSPRLQHVMWLTEIEGLSHDDVAMRLGTTAVNVAQLARRARLEFGEHYLEAHLPLPDGPVPAACTRPRKVLAEVVRGTASRRAERLAADHMATCPACAGASAELKIVNGRLRTGHIMALLPAVDASRSATVGVIAKLVAWIIGPVPTVSVAASLALATVIAPEPPDAVAESAPAASAETVVDSATAVIPARPTPAALEADDSDDMTDAALVPEAGHAGASAEVSGMDAALTTPSIILGVLGAASGLVPSSPPPATPGLLPDVGADQLVGQALDAATPVLGALTPSSVEAQLDPVEIGSLETPGAEFGVDGANGEIGVDVVAGDADLGAAAGPDGVDVVVPPENDIVVVPPLPDLPVLPVVPPG